MRLSQEGFRVSILKARQELGPDEASVVVTSIAQRSDTHTHTDRHRPWLHSETTAEPAGRVETRPTFDSNSECTNIPARLEDVFSSSVANTRTQDFNLGRTGSKGSGSSFDDAARVWYSR